MKRQKKIIIKKYDGKQEPFSEFKLTRSLRRAGASPRALETIVKTIKKNLYPGIRSRDIHDQALEMLAQQTGVAPARYNLKQALLKLGPTGHPFETFVGEILKTMNYRVLVRQYLRGKCVSHEVDVIAKRGSDIILVETKFHNHHGFKTDVKVVLYVKARFDDILKNPANKKRFNKALILTNTKFTTDAIAYGECEGIRLIGWNYPKENSLQNIIESSGLLPLTALSSLTETHKRTLLKRGVVLCQELINSPRHLSVLGISSNQQIQILNEAKEVIKLTIK